MPSFDIIAGSQLHRKNAWIRFLYVQSSVLRGQGWSLTTSVSCLLGIEQWNDHERRRSRICDTNHWEQFETRNEVEMVHLNVGTKKFDRNSCSTLTFHKSSQGNRVLGISSGSDKKMGTRLVLSWGRGFRYEKNGTTSMLRCWVFQT